MSGAIWRRWIMGSGQAARDALREPIIAILLLAGVFTVISGSYVHGGLLLAVATGLFWDAARGRRRAEARSRTVPAGAELAARAEGAPPEAPTAAVRWRPLMIVAGVACGVLYAAVVGSFTRYSWPATAAVAGLAAAVVALAWRGPLRSRPDPGKLPRRGAVLWGGLLVTAGVWELAAYFQQPSLTTISYAHPTISALIDPLLVSDMGRTVALAVWLAVGWFLVER